MPELLDPIASAPMPLARESSAPPHAPVPEKNPYAPLVEFPAYLQNLPSDDGVPLESTWHRLQMNMLIDIIEWHRRGRTDYFVGGNMFVYFSAEQARGRHFRGPDFLLANDAEYNPMRKYWAIWDEGGRYPDLIIELSSPSTRDADFTTKFKIYEDTFATNEYVIYDPEEKRIWAWRKSDGKFHPLEANDRGHFFLHQAGLWLGLWNGHRMDHKGTWLRFFDEAGNVVPYKGEAEAARADAEAARADAAQSAAESEKARADALAAELARLKAQLQSPA